MGMAASQARYLALTARKTNVEYEGQQVNQARTALANQSANLFNQLLALEVPTAPSTSDFTTLQYSYEDGVYAETITDMHELIDDPDGYNYLVTHYHYADVYTGIQNKLRNPQVKLEDTIATNSVTRNPNPNTEDGPGLNEVDGVYYIDGNQVYEYPQTEDEEALHPDLQNAFNKLMSYGEEQTPPIEFTKEELSYYRDEDGVYHFLNTADLGGGGGVDPDDPDAPPAGDMQTYTIDAEFPGSVGNHDLYKYDPTDKMLAAAYEQICKDWPDEAIAQADPEDIYCWDDGDKTYFATKEDLYYSYMSPVDPQYPTENQDKLIFYEAQDVKTKIERTEKAMIEVDGSGRWTSVKFEDSSAVYPLHTETITDEAAYQDAMNEYTYDMDVYEKQIQDINAQTEIIQQEDRTLELRLRQLDTEQDALQTEMEAVKKVIEKNIESTFKTFE